MRYYTVGELNITDRGWVRTYANKVTKLVEQCGGRYLARTSNVEKFEGERKVPQIFLIVEWPSKEIAEAFFASEEYRPCRQRRLEGAHTELVLVAGEDVAKEAQIVDQPISPARRA